MQELIRILGSGPSAQSCISQPTSGKRQSLIAPEFQQQGFKLYVRAIPQQGKETRDRTGKERLLLLVILLGGPSFFSIKLCGVCVLLLFVLFSIVYAA